MHVDGYARMCVHVNVCVFRVRACWGRWGYGADLF
jgi:hypothetical protein